VWYGVVKLALTLCSPHRPRCVCSPRGELGALPALPIACVVACVFLSSLEEQGKTLLAPSVFMKTRNHKARVPRKVFSSKHTPRRSSSLFSLYECQFTVPDTACLVNCSAHLNLAQAGHCRRRTENFFQSWASVLRLPVRTSLAPARKGEVVTATPPAWEYNGVL